MKQFVTTCFLLIFTLPVFAETYRWVDERGTINFAEDIGKVPPQYRKKAKILDEGQAAIQVIEGSEPGKGKAKGNDDSTSKVADKQEKKKELFAGKSGEAWRFESESLKNEYKAVEEQLNENKGRLSDTSKMSRNEYITVQNNIKSLEVRLATITKKMDAYNSAADKANVPSEFR